MRPGRGVSGGTASYGGGIPAGTHLLGDEPAELGVAVAEPVDGDASREVQVPPVLEVPEVGALAADEDGRRAGVRGHHVGLVLGDQAGGGRVGLGVGRGEGGVTLGVVSKAPPYS